MGRVQNVQTVQAVQNVWNDGGALIYTNHWLRSRGLGPLISLPTEGIRAGALHSAAYWSSERFELFFLAAFNFQLNRRVLDIETFLEHLFDAVQDLMKVAAVLHYRVGA
jgi:hypothetical protein